MTYGNEIIFCCYCLSLHKCKQVLGTELTIRQELYIFSEKQTTTAVKKLKKDKNKITMGKFKNG